MRRKLKLAVVLLFLVYLMVNNAVPVSLPKQSENGYANENEMIKGVWVSTVFGLDYPKQPTTDAKALSAGLDEIIKNVKEMGFNTIFFQVRPSCDAFYKSEIFPWSKYLTGDSFAAPDSGFDPLKYLIDEAHKNEISVHAWINPYRITASAGEKDLLPENSPAKLHPDWVIDYGGKLYFNPGLPEVNDFIAQGAAEIVKNYDIDGIQIDDYFYPGEDFPDDWSYSVYGNNYPDKGDWRRQNITSLIEKISAAIKKENPEVIFSVSPQGIWANADNLEGGSDTSGSEAYFNAYADTRKWVKENKIDFIIPQVYWNIGYAGADFKVLLDWWNQTADGTDVKLIIGQAAYKGAEATDSASIWYGQNGADEIKKQIVLCNNKENVFGYCMYRYSSLLENPPMKNTVIELNIGEKQMFYDISEVEWAKADIHTLYEKGIMNGIDEGVFAPYDSVTRGQFAVIMARLLNKNADFSENFSDVSPDKYYYEDIGTLKKLGLIQGISETEFAPDSAISRQDAAVLVYRILTKENIIDDLPAKSFDFTDNEQIRSYAKDAVFKMAELNLLKGYDDGSFKPAGSFTRAECSVFASRILNLLNK